MKIASITLLLLSLLLAAGCGYRVGGKADLLPTTVQIIAIPAFENLTTRYRLTTTLPRDIRQEFLSRTRYAVTTDENEGDAVLRGAIVNYSGYPVVFDPATGRASVMQVSLVLQIQLFERVSGKLLYNQPRLEVRERYEISADQQAFLDESDAALDRASRDIAKAVVSAVLEQF